MAIPFSNRTADICLPELALRDNLRVTIKEICDDFHKQYPHWDSTFECFLQLNRDKVRVPLKLEELIHSGLSFRTHPVEILPVSKFKWVSVTRLAYGIPDEDLRKALAPYGPIKRTKIEAYLGVYIGTRSVLMDVEQHIPSQLHIRGHLCHIFYRDQPRTCFRCGAPGHLSSACNREGRSARTDHPPTRHHPPGQHQVSVVDPPAGAGGLATYTSVAGGVSVSTSVAAGGSTSAAPSVSSAAGQPDAVDDEFGSESDLAEYESSQEEVEKSSAEDLDIDPTGTELGHALGPSSTELALVPFQKDKVAEELPLESTAGTSAGITEQAVVVEQEESPPTSHAKMPRIR